MKKDAEFILGLREALAHSPDNVPLRLLLAKTLLDHGYGEEAGKEYQAVLSAVPGHKEGVLGLAQSCFQQGRYADALLRIEELMRISDPPPVAYVLHARLLLMSGRKDEARDQYRWAIAADPTIADEALEEQLGPVAATPREDESGTPERIPVAPGPGSLRGEIERPTITFQDVGGMEPVKEEISLKIIHPLIHRNLFASYGKSAGGGLLLYGPPGCGKTYLARATAGEIDASFYTVGIHEVLDMWIGNSEKNLHQVFTRARKYAPCVLFFDEVDALGADRSDFRSQGASRHIINQFLEEMDGVKFSNEGVLVLAATNAPWYMDSAFRRPGRFDRVIFVPPPDQPARAVILRLLLAGRPVKDADCEHVASKTPMFSGADLKAVVDLVVENKLKEILKTGQPIPITTTDLLQAVARRRPTTLKWLDTARNYVLHANQSGEYDDLARYLNI